MRDTSLYRGLLWTALALLVALCVVTACTSAKNAWNDFTFFYNAAVAARAGENFYQTGGGGYVYPPMLAMFMIPLGMLSPLTAGIVWRLLTVALVVLAARTARREMSGRTEHNATRVQDLAVILLASLLMFDKILIEIREGQCDLLLIVPVVLALRWLGRRPMACGTVLGFAVFIKYLPIVFLPYLIVRGRWREALAMVAAMGLFAVLPALYFGWSRNWEYLMTSLRGLHRASDVASAGSGPDSAVAHGAAPAAVTQVIDWPLSVSFTSAITRVFRSHDWPVEYVKYASLAGAAAVFLGAWAVYRTRAVPLFVGRRPSMDDRSRTNVVALEWCGLIVGALVFSPQTMARHMILVFPAVMLACTLLLSRRPSALRLPIVVGLAIFTLGLVLPPGGPKYLEALTQWRSVAGASWCLLAMYLLLLWSGLRQSSESCASGPIATEAQSGIRI